MIEYQTFLEELTQIIARRASASHLVDTIAFVTEIAERLSEDPVFGEFVPVEYSGQGSHNRQLRLHGYTELDEADGAIGLVISKWSDAIEPETLSTATVSQLTGWLENFILEATEFGLCDRIVEANHAYELARLLQGSRSGISKIRLHIFSNQLLSNKFREEMLGSICGVPVERHIWDLHRIKTMYESTRERESVGINLSEFDCEGIRFLEAAVTNKIRSYLCVVEGVVLADLFDRYGSRLLEGNVRSFLGMKGGVNKGIRSTIQDAPGLFFAYNNGIAATASKVYIEECGADRKIIGFLDFQIVNGGQTTASILSARKKEKLDLASVTVQMKLTEVEPKDAHELIPKIAQFANTQNKVAAADFFANHPFHRKIEEISRRMQVPAKAGERIQSKWFYERARGQFQNERLYLTKAKKDVFDLEYPSGQVINKTDLAKYDHVWHEVPHLICLGAQKNFAKFASRFSSTKQDQTESELWTILSPDYGELYYQRIVAIAILWKKTELVVSAGRGTWYKGDYRSQIVAYALSLIFRTLRANNYEMDVSEIWKNQTISREMEEYVRSSAIAVQGELLAPPSGAANVGEWCKKDACWERVKSITFEIPPGVAKSIIPKVEYDKAAKQGRLQGREDDAIAAQEEVLKLVRNGYWSALLKWPRLSHVVAEHEYSLILKASSLQGFLKIATAKEWMKLLAIKDICEKEGFRIS